MVKLDFLGCDPIPIKTIMAKTTKAINKQKKKRAVFKLFKPKVKVELRKGNLYKITVLSV